MVEASVIILLFIALYAIYTGMNAEIKMLKARVSALESIAHATELHIREGSLDVLEVGDAESKG